MVSLLRSVALPALVVLGALLLRVLDPLPIEALRNLVFDTYETWVPRPYVDAGVRVVDIDDESLARIGQWPWPRNETAHLVDQLRTLGAAAIGLDIVFAEPDRTSPKSIVPIWQQSTNIPLPPALLQLPDHDALLAAAIARAPTVLGLVLVNQGGSAPQPRWGLAMRGGDIRRSLVTFNGAVENLPLLQQQTPGLGVLNSEPDKDGIIRSAPLLFALRGGGLYPALVSETLRVASHASTYIVDGVPSGSFMGLADHAGMNGLRIGSLAIPTDGRGRVTLYDTGPVPERTIPAWRVFTGAVDPAAIAGKLIFVGTSAAGLADLRSTPLRPLVPGVEIHAQIAEQIRLGTFLRRPNWIAGAELLWLVGLCGILLWALSKSGPGAAAVLGLAAIALASGISWLAFRRFGLLIDPVYPSLAATALYLVQSFNQHLRSEQNRQYLKSAFGRYVSPALLEQLVEDSSRLKLGGETRVMSIMFCDIRGFTSFAETMDAERLTHFINSFFTPMTECVLVHRGTIDKYIGDCLMAFWNAPVVEPHHAEYAVRAALDMARKIVSLNDGWEKEARAAGRPFTPIGIGIGIATGPCCVGNLGSEQRFDYSVLGDDVNLASRLEGQTKTYRTPIVISEATEKAIAGFATLELDLLRVKGRLRPARIYTVIGDESVAAREDFMRLRAVHEAMLAAYRRQRWAAAAEIAMRLRNEAPPELHGLYDSYFARITGMAAQGLPEEWDGVATAETK